LRVVGLPFDYRDRVLPDENGNFFDEKAGNRVVRFIQKRCRHVKGALAGQNLILEEWEEQLVTEIFGWKRPDGSRQYQTVYVFVARKNGKSTLGAAIALYLLFVDREPGGEIYSAAADRFQAAIIFDIAKQMVELDPFLQQYCDVLRHNLFHRETRGIYRALSADAGTKHGLNSSGVIFDELHTQKNRDLYDVLNTSTGARAQPLVMYFTTAGYDKESVCYEVHQYAEQVAAGLVEDDTFLPVIYETKEEEDWESEDVWAKANPNMGVSVRMDYLRKEYRKATQIPAYQNTFRRLHLNQWTEQASRWLDVATWDALVKDVDLTALEGQQCYAGLDLASTRDLTACVLYFPASGWVMPFFWVPIETAKLRTKQDKVKYTEWIRRGFIEGTEGNVADYDHIRAKINALGDMFKIVELAIDPWNSQDMETKLEGDGFTVVPMRQGFQTMNPACKIFERLLLEGNLAHSGNPVLRWCIANVSTAQDPAGNLKPDKSKSNEKIDGAVAAIMAVGRASTQPQFKSRYQKRGIITLQ
jgi:phage terminase large subunit-like protein